MNKSVGSIHEYADRFEVMNTFDASLNTVCRAEMTPAQTRMMKRLINRFCSECFEVEQWVETRHSGYFEDCTLHILSERRRQFRKLPTEKATGM